MSKNLIDTKRVFTADPKVIHRVPVLAEGVERIKGVPVKFLKERIVEIQSVLKEKILDAHDSKWYEDHQKIEQLVKNTSELLEEVGDKIETHEVFVQLQDNLDTVWKSFLELEPSEQTIKLVENILREERAALNAIFTLGSSVSVGEERAEISGGIDFCDRKEDRIVQKVVKNPNRFEALDKLRDGLNEKLEELLDSLPSEKEIPEDFESRIDEIDQKSLKVNTSLEEIKKKIEDVKNLLKKIDDREDLESMTDSVQKSFRDEFLSFVSQLLDSIEFISLCDSSSEMIDNYNTNEERYIEEFNKSTEFITSINNIKLILKKELLERQKKAGDNLGRIIDKVKESGVKQKENMNEVCSVLTRDDVQTAISKILSLIDVENADEIKSGLIRAVEIAKDIEEKQESDIGD
ncbi:hypothetical protein JW758_05025 [Candidatus Peregrinibacteria bacterium]|nr:hypothetical protein [Candidatus Peregrinibacteria bacterium]